MCWFGYSLTGCLPNHLAVRQGEKYCLEHTAGLLVAKRHMFLLPKQNLRQSQNVLIAFSMPGPKGRLRLRKPSPNRTEPASSNS